MRRSVSDSVLTSFLLLVSCFIYLFQQMRIECFHYLGQEDVAISDDEDEGAGGGANKLAHALLAFHEQASNVLATRRLAVSAYSVSFITWGRLGTVSAEMKVMRLGNFEIRNGSSFSQVH